MAITPLPTLDRTAATFKTDVDDFFSTDLPLFVTEANALETAVDADATAAAASASAASTSASNASTSAGNAATSETNAATSASNAATSAATAASAPGTSATSTTSLTIGTGSKALTIETGKSIVVGMSVKIAETATPTNWMHGDVTAYNSGSGALTVNVTNTNGSGTIAAWTVSLSAPSPALQIGGLGVSPEYTATNKTLTVSNGGYQIVSSGTATAITITLPDATTILNETGLKYIFQNDGDSTLTICNDSNKPIAFADSGEVIALNLEDNSTTDGTWSTLVKTTRSINFLKEIGDGVVFETDLTLEPHVIKLSDTKLLVVYDDNGNSNYGTACILDISGSTITPGTPVVFESASVDLVRVSALSSTKAIVAYQDVGNTDYGTACILDISGSTITPGTPVVFNSAATHDIDVVALSATQAIVVYRNGGATSNGTACILDVSGSTITPGTPAEYETGNSQDNRVAMLTSTKAMVVYTDSVAASYGEACILDVSGSTITPGTAMNFNATASTNLNLMVLSSTRAVCVYKNASTIESCVLDVSGSTITANTITELTSAIAYSCIASGLSATELVVVFRDSTDADGHIFLAELSGDTFVAQPSDTFHVGTFNIPGASVVGLSSTTAVVCYYDSNNSNYGTARFFIREI